jgi:predicted nucleic acid-binding Zn ribbon protein
MVDPLPGDQRRDAPRPVKAGLDAVLRRLGAAPSESITTVIEAWPELVGPEIAQRSHPRRLEESTLFVAADDPSLVSHLAWQEPSLLEAVRALLGSEQPTRLDVTIHRP